MLLEPGAKIPSKAHPDDAGFDLYAASWEAEEDTLIYKTGVAVNIPPGWEGQLRARSSIRKYALILCNGVGTIDAGYTGDLTFTFRYNYDGAGQTYKIGDKIGQIVFQRVPIVELVQVEAFEPTTRGAKGHGSTGV